MEINIDVTNFWEKIAKANSEIDLFEVERNEKQKDGTYKKKIVKYAEVKERVIAFRKVYPLGRIDTRMEQTDNYIKFTANVLVDGMLLATGTARELSNKPFALENCETSAIGRALGFAGFGIKTGIASAEDMQQIDSPSGMFENINEDIDKRKQVEEKFNSLEPKTKAGILNFMKVKDIKDIQTNTLEDLIKNFNV